MQDRPPEQARGGQAGLYGVGLTGPDNAAEAIGIGHFNDHTIVVTGHWNGSLDLEPVNTVLRLPDS